MKVKQQFPQLASIRRRPSNLGAFESLMDLLSNAALLIDTKKQSVILANSRFSGLSSFTRNELSEKPLKELFPDLLDSDTAGSIWGEKTALTSTLQTRTGAEIDAFIESTPIDSQDNIAVLQVTTASQLTQNRAEEERERNRWEAMRVLVLAAEQTSADAAVDQILQSAHLLTGAGILGIYSNEPSRGDSLTAVRLPEAVKFPKELELSEVSHLQVPYLWKPGERSVSPLHSIAISEKLAYLASVPIDQSNPLGGIFIVGDREVHANEDLLPIMNLIASSLGIHILPHILPEKQFADNLPSPKNSGTNDYERIFDALEEGLILLDPSLRIRAINLAAESILGVRSAEMVGQKAEDILITSPSIVPGLMEVLNGAPFWKMEEVNLRHRKGQTVPASIRAISLASEESQDEEAIAVIFADLSDEEQYRARAQQLEQQAFLGEVSAIFAHEVRNPINNISTGLELMSMELTENEDVQDQIARIQDDFERLTDLMKSVLSFSGRREYQIMRIDLVSVVERILDRWRVRSPKNSIAFHLAPPPAPALVDGDQRAIEQVLTNLISNSVKAMEDSGGDLTVKFSTSHDESGGHFVEILISDTGPGIPGEVIEHIFEPFYTTKKEGTGLGLAISKRIVEAHKGMISAQSFPGVTIFKVTLPAVIDQQENTQE